VKREKESEVAAAENAAGKFQAQKVIVIGKSEESWAASFCFFVIRPENLRARERNYSLGKAGAANAGL
jgi:hypothetical protein